MTRKNGGVDLQWTHTDTAKQRKQKINEFSYARLRDVL